MYVHVYTVCIHHFNPDKVNKALLVLGQRTGAHHREDYGNVNIHMQKKNCMYRMYVYITSIQLKA
jgi:hypothetical protein